MVKRHETFKCPLCDKIIGPCSRGITFHARSHNISDEQLWLLKNGLTESPKCACTPECSNKVNWRNWDYGYATYFSGHSFRIAKRVTLRGKNHWAYGKTKLTDERLLISSKKKSITFKKKFDSGEMTSWSKGKTKENNETLLRISKKNLGLANHKYDINNVMSLIKERLGDNHVLVTSVDDIAIRKNNISFEIKFRCTRCSRDTMMSIYNLVRKRRLQKCKCCDHGMSYFENEVFQFVKSLGHNVIKGHQIEKTELDIFVPSLNFAIECHGLYWHSTAVQKNTQHHQNKQRICAKHDITLLQLFEDEWRDKRTIVESMIKRYMSILTIVATEIVQLNNNEAKLFFDENHVEGYLNSNQCVAIKINNCVVYAALVNVIDCNHVQIIRFATLNDHHVDGLYAIINFLKMSIIDLCIDTRFEKKPDSKFVLSKTIKPTFWWTDTINRFYSKNAIKNASRAFKIYGCNVEVYNLKDV